MILEVFLATTGLGTLLGPAVAIVRSNKKHAAELEKLKNESKNLQQSDREYFYELGRKSVLAEWKKLKDDARSRGESLSYRQAANIIESTCGKCGKHCLHCAKMKKQVDQLARDMEEELNRPFVKDEDKLDAEEEALKIS